MSLIFSTDTGFTDPDAATAAIFCASISGAGDWTVTAGCQAPSSNPGRFHPGCSSRASYVTPVYRLSYSSGPVAVFHEASLPIVSVDPSR